MPYIRQEDRAKLRPLLEQLYQSIHSDGEMNYVITKLIDYHYGDGAYMQLNAGMGVLACVTQEFYRKRIAPYEDERAVENGEVFE